MEDQKEILLPRYILDTLTLRVYNKIPQHPNICAPNSNAKVIEKCKQIIYNPQAVSSVIIEATKDMKQPVVTGVAMYRFFLSSVFIVLYYMRKDDKVFNISVFPQFKTYINYSNAYENIMKNVSEIHDEEKIVKEVENKKLLAQCRKNNQDYTKLPRMDVYRDRKSLDEFDVDTEGSIEKLMLERMFVEEYIYDLEGADEYMLKIFNTAHYITTMILSDNRPMQHFSLYTKKALKIGAAPNYDQNTYGRFFASMALAMVVNYLRVCDDKYCDQDELFIKNIYKWFKDHFDDKQWDGKARFVFYNNVVPQDVIMTARQFMGAKDFIPEKSLEEIKSSKSETWIVPMTGDIDVAKSSSETEEQKQLKEKDNTIAELRAEVKRLQDELKKSKDKHIEKECEEIADEESQDCNLTNEVKDADIAPPKIFDRRINENKIIDALKKLRSDKVSGKRRWYVIYRVLHYIGWIGKAQNRFIDWVEYYFGWEEKKEFRGVQSKLINTSPNEWSDVVINGKEEKDNNYDIGPNYYEFAGTIVRTFVEIDETGQLTDKDEFLVNPKGAGILHRNKWK